MTTYLPTRQFAGPNNEILEFSMKSRIDRAATIAQKKDFKKNPVMTDQETLTISFLGQKDKIDLEINEETLTKYGNFYHIWKSGGAANIDGTAIVAWAGCNQAMARNLEAAGVLTVEMLSKLSDAQAQNIGSGVINLRDDAVKWLAKQSTLDAKELARLREDKQKQDELITALASRLEAIESKPQKAAR